jgi:hypothetical protein
MSQKQKPHDILFKNVKGIKVKHVHKDALYLSDIRHNQLEKDHLEIKTMEKLRIDKFIIKKICFQGFLYGDIKDGYIETYPRLNHLRLANCPDLIGNLCTNERWLSQLFLIHTGIGHICDNCFKGKLMTFVAEGNRNLKNSISYIEKLTPEIKSIIISGNNTEKPSTIPQKVVGRFLHLKELYLRDCNLSGIIPEWISECPLEVFNIDENHFKSQPFFTSKGGLKALLPTLKSFSFDQKDEKRSAAITFQVVTCFREQHDSMTNELKTEKKALLEQELPKDLLEEEESEKTKAATKRSNSLDPEVEALFDEMQGGKRRRRTKKRRKKYQKYRKYENKKKTM